MQTVYLSQSLIVVAAILCACADQTSEWKEDVQSPDGTVVTLTRHQEYSHCGALGASSSRCPRNYWFTFRHPNTHQTVRWEQTHHELGTVALVMREREDVYLLTLPLLGGTDRHYGCPSPPYILWKHNPTMSEDGKTYASWFRVPLSQAPFERVEANLTFGAPKIGITHLPVETTRTQSYDQVRKWVIDLQQAPLQTFGLKNCDKRQDLLIAKDVG